MSFLSKVTAYAAPKTTKVAKGSGGFVKGFVADVRNDMKAFDELDKRKSAQQSDIIIDHVSTEKE